MKMREFLFNLAAEPGILARFRREPDALMADAGLSQSDCQVIAEGDTQKLRSILFSESKVRDSSGEYEVSQVPPTVSPPPDVEPPSNIEPLIEPPPPPNVEP